MRKDSALALAGGHFPRAVAMFAAVWLTMEVENIYLRAGTYEVTEEYGTRVLVAHLPAGYPYPMSQALMVDALTQVACTARAKAGSGIDVPIGVLLQVGDRIKGHAFVRTCPTV